MSVRSYRVYNDIQVHAPVASQISIVSNLIGVSETRVMSLLFSRGYHTAFVKEILAKHSDEDYSDATWLDLAEESQGPDRAIPSAAQETLQDEADQFSSDHRHWSNYINASPARRMELDRPEDNQFYPPIDED